MINPQRNGHGQVAVMNRPRRDVFPGPAEDPALAEVDCVQQQEFSLTDESGKWGIQLRPSRPTIVIAIGTTPLRILLAFYHHVIRECGTIPASIQLLSIEISTEAAHDRPFPILALAQDGAGTAAIEGLEIILRYGKEITEQIARQGALLSHSDPLAPASCSSEQGITVVVLFGSGGSGGGGCQPVISYAHSALRPHTRNLQVLTTNLGPEMSLLDTNRRTSANQQLHVPENAGNNWAQLLSDFRSAGTLVEEHPQLAPFSLRAQDRVSGLTALDRSNGRHTFSTVDEFIPMVARQLFLSTLSPANGWSNARKRDLDVLGDTYRGRVAEAVFHHESFNH